MKTVIIMLSLFWLSAIAQADAKTNNPIVIMHTSKGDITIELFQQKAPITVANFLDYAKSGFYDGTIFHRVIKRFVIQGGGFTPFMEKKETKAPIKNESDNGLYNDRWTLSMARTNDPDSATSQFFINLKMNSNLNKRGKNPGYAVFAEVVDGRHIVKDIAKSPTRTVGPYSDVPVEPIIIESVEIVGENTTADTAEVKE